MPPNIFFSWVNAICEPLHNDFQIITGLGSATGIQRCSDYCGF